MLSGRKAKPILRGARAPQQALRAVPNYGRRQPEVVEVKQKNLSSHREGQWTRLEVGIWLAALIITITLGVLAVTDSVGSWAVLIPSAMGMIMALWRYRVETERKKQTLEDQSR